MKVEIVSTLRIEVPCGRTPEMVLADYLATHPGSVADCLWYGDSYRVVTLFIYKRV